MLETLIILLLLFSYPQRRYKQSNVSHLIVPLSPQLSVPCDRINAKPDFKSLWNYVDKVNNNVSIDMYINLRYIVMKRNWIETIVSSCIHRFGDCKERVRTHYNGFTWINEQLQQIKQKYWIMIDYFDLCKRPNEYAPIFSKWLNINNDELVRNALSVIRSSNTSHIDKLKSYWNEVQRWDKGEYIEPTKLYFAPKRYVKQDLNFSLADSILEKFSFEQMKQTVWIDNCVVVDPDNLQFLQFNHTCNWQQANPVYNDTIFNMIQSVIDSTNS